MTDDVDVRLIPTLVHGRVLVRGAHAAAAKGLIVGFHGYMESAALQMERLAAIPGARGWTLVAVQALNRFYQGRTERVVAGWMTRQDREAAIADNINYVDAALDSVPHDEATRVVYAGFSQGVAMAFRAAVRGRAPGAGVIAIGGDVPPELLADPSSAFPPCCWFAANATSGSPRRRWTRMSGPCISAAWRSRAWSTRARTSGTTP